MQTQAEAKAGFSGSQKQPSGNAEDVPLVGGYAAENRVEHGCALLINRYFFKYLIVVVPMVPLKANGACSK